MIFIVVSMVTILWMNNCYATNISVSKVGWSVDIDENDLIFGVGSELQSVYNSSGNSYIINITQPTTSGWRVNVQRSDSTWDNNFVISVKRTSDGQGSATISGGTNYVEISNSGDIEFFTGSGRCTAIRFQYQLSGISLNILPNIYRTTVTYTVVDT